MLGASLFTAPPRERGHREQIGQTARERRRVRRGGQARSRSCRTRCRAGVDRAGLIAGPPAVNCCDELRLGGSHLGQHLLEQRRRRPRTGTPAERDPAPRPLAVGAVEQRHPVLGGPGEPVEEALLAGALLGDREAAEALGAARVVGADVEEAVELARARWSGREPPCEAPRRPAAGRRSRAGRRGRTAGSRSRHRLGVLEEGRDARRWCRAARGSAGAAASSAGWSTSAKRSTFDQRALRGRAARPAAGPPTRGDVGLLAGQRVEHLPRRAHQAPQVAGRRPSSPISRL